SRLAARLGRQARLEGSGRLALSEAKQPTKWEAELALTDAAIDADLVPIAVTVFPPIASLGKAVSEAPDTDWGALSLSLAVQGTGIVWPDARKTVVGEGTVALDHVRIPAESLLARIAAMAGHQRDGLTLEHGSATFRVADEWVSLARVQSEGALLVPPVTGRVAMDGRLDLDVDLMPLVQAYGGGAFAAVRGVTSTIPIRVVGTVDEPEIKRPGAGSLAKGLLGGLRHRVVGAPDGG
ncbi:MAG: hypothetical protein AAF721_41415, partial [Myxococcota bacterium]